MKAIIDISESGFTSLIFTDDEGQIIWWEDLTQDEQMKLLDSLKNYHKLFSKFIK